SAAALEARPEQSADAPPARPHLSAESRRRRHGDERRRGKGDRLAGDSLRAGRDYQGRDRAVPRNLPTRSLRFGIRTVAGAVISFAEFSPKGGGGPPWRPEDGPAEPAGHRTVRSEEHTSELQSRGHLVCRLLLE